MGPFLHMVTEADRRRHPFEDGTPVAGQHFEYGFDNIGELHLAITPRRLLLVFPLVLLLGCAKPNDRLFGNWVSEPIDSEWGKVIITFKIQPDGRIESTMSSVGGGVGLSRWSSYSVRGDWIESHVLGGGEPAKFWFDEADLLIDTAEDPPRRFSRK